MAAVTVLRSIGKYVFPGSMVLALMVAASCGGGQTVEDAAPPANDTAPAALAAAGRNTARITMASFNDLKEGMSYREVVEIIGGEGRILSESTESGIENKTYRWEGSGRPGANADVTFQNDKLAGKDQFGLM